jgi:molecular chaperone IbpA
MDGPLVDLSIGPIGPLRTREILPISSLRGPRRTRNQPVRPFRADLLHVAQGGYAMRTFDLAPLYRSTVGFDRLFSLVDQLAGHDGSAQGYPPYNIERTGENAYRISVAVAGFSEDELHIEAKESTLTIRGEKQPKTEDKTGETLYRGIAARTFDRVFQLADYVQVRGASLEHGLLHVDLVREIPEAKKPRRIAIGNSRLVEAKAA